MWGTSFNVILEQRWSTTHCTVLLYSCLSLFFLFFSFFSGIIRLSRGKEQEQPFIFTIHLKILEFYAFCVQVVDYFVDPFVAGSSGGDPESLSVSNIYLPFM